MSIDMKNVNFNRPALGSAGLCCKGKEGRMVYLKTLLISLFLLPACLFAEDIDNEPVDDDKIVTTVAQTEDKIPLDKAGVVSLALQNADVATVMKGIAQLGNYDFVTKGEIAKNVNLTLKGRSIRQALDIISDSTATEYRIDGNIITVFGDGMDPSYTKTYTVMKGNTLVIGQVLTDLIGATMVSQGAQNNQEGATAQPAAASNAIDKGHARIVVDKLNGQIIITAFPSDHRKVENVWPAIDMDKPPKRYESKMFELKFLTPSVFKRSIKFLIPGIEDNQIFTFLKEGEENNDAASLSASEKRLIIQETPGNIKRIEELLTQIDVPPRQVVIDVKMVEFTLDKNDKLGVDWKSIFTENGRNIPVGEFFAPLSNTGTSRFKFGSLGPDHLQIILDFVKTSTNARVLSNPQITALDGVTAKLTVADKIPYRTSTTNQGATVTEVNFENAGVTLEVTPVIFKNDFVNLYIKPVVSSNSGEFDGVPIVSTKETETTLNIRNNHTVIMGGLITHTDSREHSTVPVLGQIPGLRKFFRREGTTKESSELVFLITPKIYSEFETHPHDQLRYEFQEPNGAKPIPVTFVDKQQQERELREYEKRSKL
jgi:type II secretory pathway component GspD/PulD (secretin)